MFIQPNFMKEIVNPCVRLGYTLSRLGLTQCNLDSYEFKFNDARL